MKKKILRKKETKKCNIPEKNKIGLTTEEVKKRIHEGKVNIIPKSPSRSIWQIIRANVFTLFNAINLVLAVIVIIAGSPKNSIFAGVIISNTIIGILQELKAKRTIEKLSILAKSKAIVIRDGQEKEIDIEDIVVDDVIFLKSGNQIPVDAKVIKDNSIEVDESLLTGEPDIIIKNEGDVLYSGSFVGGNSGYAVVTSVGADTYSSKLSKEAKKFKKIKSELQSSMNRILKVIIKIIIPTGMLLTFTQMYFSKKPWQEAVLGVVAGISGMIPEGLVLLISVTFVVSIVKLSKYNTLVQELPATEILARVDTLCLDKTGTITEGRLNLVEVRNFNDDLAQCEEAIKAIVTAFPVVNQTQQAILEKYGEEANSITITSKVPFSSATKWSAVTTDSGKSYYLGAPEILYSTKYDEIKEQVEEEALKGRRVLLLAEYDGEAGATVPEDIKKTALIILEDEIRPEAPETLKYFEENNVDIKIISGDNPVTVSATAKRAGVKNYDKYIDMTTVEHNSCRYMEIVDEYTIFGRVTPHQKRDLVKALKEQNHTVAMTGDGINDVLALKESDCGIAMASGSDSSKAVSQLVLLDSNFASLPKVVQEGRQAINNLELAANLYLTKTVYAVLLSVIFALILLPFPYTPIQMSLIGSLGIGIPSFFIALQANKDMVKEGFLRRILVKSLPNGIGISFGVVVASIIMHFNGYTDVKTTTICTLIIGILSMIILLKVSEPLTLMKICVVICAVGLFITAFLLGLSMKVFGFAVLNRGDIILAGVCIFASLVVIELTRGILIRYLSRKKKK